MELPTFILTQRGPRSFHVEGKQALADQLQTKHGFTSAGTPRQNEFARLTRNGGLEFCIIYTSGSVVASGDNWQRLYGGLSGYAKKCEALLGGVGDYWHLYSMWNADGLRDWQRFDEYVNRPEEIWAGKENLLATKQYLEIAMTDKLSDFRLLGTKDDAVTWYISHLPLPCDSRFMFGVGWYKGLAVVASPYQLYWLEQGNVDVIGRVGLTVERSRQ